MGQQEAQSSYEEIQRTMEFMQALEYEKALFLYISALERGDADQMARILKQAETDPVLEKMIEETHEVYAEEMNLPEPTDEERARVKATLAKVLAEQKGKEQSNGR